MTDPDEGPEGTRMQKSTRSRRMSPGDGKRMTTKMQSNALFGLFACKECKVSIYTLTTREMLEHWSEICPAHQTAAKLAAESMLATLQELISR